MEKVAICNIKKESGFLYYVDREGDVSRAVLNRCGKAFKKHEGKAEKVRKVGITRENGYLYFLDKEGDVARTKIIRKKKI